MQIKNGRTCANVCVLLCRGVTYVPYRMNTFCFEIILVIRNASSDIRVGCILYIVCAKELPVNRRAVSSVRKESVCVVCALWLGSSGIREFSDRYQLQFVVVACC